MSPLLAPLFLAQAVPDAGLTAACGDAPGIVCRLVYDATGKETMARVVEWIVAKPLKVLLVVAVAWLLVALLRRGIRRLVEGLVSQREEQAARRREEIAEAPAGRSAPASARSRRLAEQAERGRQRAQALGTVLRSVVSVVIWSLAALIVLGEFGVNLGPLIAGAGIAGIALGFGAQSLVRDFLSGVFMLAEDQYGVGDVVDLGDAAGTVEEIRLRTTRLRDGEGTVWFVPNGEIRRVANKSQRWARAVLDFEVAYDTDLDAGHPGDQGGRRRRLARAAGRRHRPRGTGGPGDRGSGRRGGGPAGRPQGGSRASSGRWPGWPGAASRMPSTPPGSRAPCRSRWSGCARRPSRRRSRKPEPAPQGRFRRFEEALVSARLPPWLRLARLPTYQAAAEAGALRLRGRPGGNAGGRPDLPPPGPLGLEALLDHEGGRQLQGVHADGHRPVLSTFASPAAGRAR